MRWSIHEYKPSNCKCSKLCGSSVAVISYCLGVHIFHLFHVMNFRCCILPNLNVSVWCFEVKFPWIVATSGVRGGGSAAPPPGLKKIRANSVFRASASCSKVLNNKKYFIAVKNSGKTLCSRAIASCSKFWMMKNIYSIQWIQSTRYFSGQVQVAQKSLRWNTFQDGEKVQGNSVFQGKRKLFEILNDKKLVTWQNSVAPQKSLGRQKIWGTKMFNFRRKTLFCLGYRLSKRKITLFSKNLGGITLLADPWLRLRRDDTRQCLPYHNHEMWKTN